MTNQQLRLAVLVPTRNESASIAEFLGRLGRAVPAVSGAAVTIVLLDDSDDDTVVVARAAAPRGMDLQVIWRPPHERIGTISGALMEGLRRIQADAYVVMDADLQHPPELLATLANPLLDASAGLDVTIGTRYATGGSAAGLTTGWRRFASAAAGDAVRTVFPRLRRLSDPASGLFGFRSDVIADVELRPLGFKILTEILVRGTVGRVGEVPYEFCERAGGLSNFGPADGADFLKHLVRLRLSVSHLRSGELDVRHLVPVGPASAAASATVAVGFRTTDGLASA